MRRLLAIVFLGVLLPSFACAEKVLSDKEQRELQRMQQRTLKYKPRLNIQKDPEHLSAPDNANKAEVGITLSFVKTRFIVSQVIPLSAAATAGVRVGDEIVAIDGRKVYPTMDIPTLLMKINGDPGTQVVLLIGRKTSGYVTLTVHREDSKALPDFAVEQRDGVGYVKVVRFGDTLRSTISDQLNTLAAASPKGLVIDLRNAEGGRIEAAGALVGAFVDKGTIYVQEGDANGAHKLVTDIAPGVTLSVPVVFIINKLTALPGEIAVAALQDYDRINLIGERTAHMGTLILPDGTPYSPVVNQLQSPYDIFLTRNGIAPQKVVKERVGTDALYNKAVQILQTPNWDPLKDW